MRNRLDGMKEMANIGTGYAATALSSLLGANVVMDVPAARYLCMAELPRFRFTEDEEIAAVYAPLGGELSGGMFFMATTKAAAAFSAYLLEEKLKLKPHVFAASELAQSAFQEVGNLLIGAYLTALSKLTDLKCYPLVTELSIDLASAVLAEGALHLIDDEECIVMETDICLPQSTQPLDGLLLFIPDKNASVTLTQALEASCHD
ncbi:chemotaxis protein CheC [Shouchella clausii]|uniref:CheC-like protein domain-containing protein n=1 Tax=Shouchella clausii TaxID=79880 RepID=A0A268S3V2_SHOCL|nr:chemotaxis protein CheC [Shouchella clausii]PAD44651.1 hypothetical protein CHH54_01005 [Bacillus sp. 7520-S]MBU8594865.1 chemotaxis protein CheC [Shouchella clausii]MCY1104912.1 chemotaxis protein CheC [Shouchella clausii]MEB5481473.1 chemotaxis protein CheC [Shouchella clausii]MED4157751.1 chemotaxis protein CheC [Shouchella clausii]